MTDRCNTIDNVIYNANIIWSLEGEESGVRNSFAQPHLLPQPFNGGIIISALQTVLWSLRKRMVEPSLPKQ